jgi:hypothetical protein
MVVEFKLFFNLVKSQNAYYTFVGEGEVPSPYTPYMDVISDGFPSLI